MKNRWTDVVQIDGKNNVALPHPYHEGSHVASLVKFHPVVKEQIA